MLWAVFAVLMLVHALEGFYCEAFAFLRGGSMTSRDASALLCTLSKAQPKLVWHVGLDHSRCAKITSWQDTSSPQPPLSELLDGLAGVMLKVCCEFSVQNERHYLQQKHAFQRQIDLKEARSTEVTTQLFVPGFSEFTHKQNVRLPVMRVLVSDGTCPLAQVAVFWLAHMSLVLALPYRVWLLCNTGTASYVVAKQVTLC